MPEKKLPAETNTEIKYSTDPKNSFRVTLTKDKKQVLFLMTVDGIANFATYNFKSQALRLAEFLIDVCNNLEDDYYEDFESH